METNVTKLCIIEETWCLGEIVLKNFLYGTGTDCEAESAGVRGKGRR